MKRFFLFTFLLIIFLTKPLLAAQSSITEAEGNACMGDDKSRKQTEQAAFTEARKRAVEFTSTRVKSETEVKNFVVEKDLLAAYAHAEVKVIQELEKVWYKDPASGDCCRVKIKAEVIPDEKSMEKLAQNAQFSDDPAAPLKVQSWTDKRTYKKGEKVKVYIRGNKPFYARVLYRDATGETLQILPNPYRQDNYFNGGAVYEIPAGNDRFDLEVSPPFGEESILVYAGTVPLGAIDLESRGAVYQVKTRAQDIGVQTRGVQLTERPAGRLSLPVAAEIFEDKVVVKTGK